MHLLYSLLFVALLTGGSGLGVASHMDRTMDEVIKLCALHVNNPAVAENCAKVRDMQRLRDEVRNTLRDPRKDHQRALDYFQIQKFLDGKG